MEKISYFELAKISAFFGGVVFLVLALVAYKTGKLYGKYGVDLKKDNPSSFWIGLIYYSVIGILLIWFSTLRKI